MVKEDECIEGRRSRALVLVRIDYFNNVKKKNE